MLLLWVADYVVTVVDYFVVVAVVADNDVVVTDCVVVFAVVTN